MNIGSQMISNLVRNVCSGRSMLVLAGLVLLTGCEAAKSHIEDWSNIPERHHSTANRVFYTHDVLFGLAQTTMNASERKRLKIFIDNTAVRDSDRVSVVPGSSPTGRLRAQGVIQFLGASNRRIHPVQAAETKVGGPSGEAISVVVSRYVVTLPACPDWTGERFTYNNVPTSNWGCATAINLGRMVANPEDLVRGRNPGTFDGEYAAHSIDLYRKGETKSLTQESIGPVKSKQQSSSKGGG